MSSRIPSGVDTNDVMQQAQVAASQYNTPFIKSKPAPLPSKELISYYRQLNSVRLLHRKVVENGKEIRSIEKQLPELLCNTLGHRYRTILKQFNILESNFETTTPSDDMKDSISILNLIIDEQKQYKLDLEKNIQEENETKHHKTLSRSRKGRMRSVIRVTDHRRKTRMYKKDKRPVLFEPWLENVINQKVAETSKISDVRKRL